MKNSSRISWPVWVLGTVAVVLTLTFVWYQSSRRSPAPVAAESPLPPVAANVAEAAPAPGPPPQAAPLSGELPPVVPISLAGLFTTEENDQWNKSGVFKVMPRGPTNLGGVEFVLEGLIQLQCRSSKDENRTYRERITIPLTLTNDTAAGVEIVQRGSNVASLHLLGATRYGGEGDGALADLVWRYADGSAKRTPIRFENHVRDWIRLPYETPAYLPYPFSKVVWHAPAPGQAGRSVRLYRFSYANPAPAKIIRQLELVSAMETPNLFLVGMTLDPLRLGERPDDSPNLEPPDPVPPVQMDLSVLTTNDVAVPSARVRVLIQQATGKSPARFERTLTTDVRGVARVSFPPAQDLDRLDLTASHEDYGSRKMVWDTKAGDNIPASYTLKLVPGIAIGGVVVDDMDTPIAGAKLNFYRFWTGPSPMNQRGEQSDFPSRSIASDAQGFWQMKGLPPELLANIGFRVNHPDHVETNYTVGQNQNTEQQLRAGTFKVILRRGLLVTGKVTDENDRPLAGATVTAGRYNFSGTRSAKTDVQGVFTIRDLSAGAIQFSALAKGHKPEIKTVEVKPDMPEVLFKLGPGLVLRGLVKDANGEPIPSVRIALESKTGGVSDTYPLELSTGTDGRFEWDGAPEEPLNFCFLKQGYEAKRRQTLKPTEENVITLRHSRKIEGWVLDATTERPVTKFRVGTGRSLGVGEFFADYPGMRPTADANGRFTLEVSEEEIRAVKAEADDYAEKIESLPEAQNGVVQVIVKLQPSAALRGVLVTSEGTPVSGASVGISSSRPGQPGTALSFRNGRLEDFGRQGKVVTTSSSGEFVLNSPPETGSVIAAGETGFALAPIRQVRDSGRLVLQTFGRIEGTFKLRGQPAAGQEFTFTMRDAGIMFDFSQYKATTDENGRFTISKIPPGEGQIVRLIKHGQGWMHSHNTDVTVLPGQVTPVTLGDSGAVLEGKVRFETPPAEGEKLNLEGRLSTKLPPMPAFGNAEEARAFTQSPEWQARVKLMKSFGVSIAPDGSWSMDSIPPGTYTLRVTASKAGERPWEKPPVATGTLEVTVPDGASPQTPIPLGEVILRPNEKKTW